MRGFCLSVAAVALAVSLAAAPSPVAAKGKLQKFPADLTDKARNPTCVASDRSALPSLLSETGCVLATDPTAFTPGVIPVTVNMPQWADGSEIRRWAAIPDGETVKVLADGDFELPVGTVLIQEFRYGNRRHETRLLTRHDDGEWAGYSYRWLADQSDAELLPAGGTTATLANGVRWAYPSRAECIECHSEAAGYSLGLNVEQMNRVKWMSRLLHPDLGTQINQLLAWQAMGLFDPAQGLDTMDRVGPGGTSKQIKKGKEPVVAASDFPSLARSLDDYWVPIAMRARSYLHTNCAGCHQPGGTAPSAFDLRYSTPIGETGLCNGIPNDDLGDSRNRLLVPGLPWRSVVYHRIRTRNANQMPPLGTTEVDVQGRNLIYRWIEDDSVCDAFADGDEDGVTDDVDNCMLVANPAQMDVDTDGFGNFCDGDLDDNGISGEKDDKKAIKTLLTEFQSGGYWPAGRRVDYNGDGFVTKEDQKLIKSVMKQLKNQPPGPSCCE